MQGSVVVLALLAVGVSANHVCRLRDIPHQPSLVESRLNGVWYEEAFYYSTRYTSRPTYWNFVYQFSQLRDGVIRVIEQYKPDGVNCGVQNEVNRNKVYNAEYTFLKKGAGIPAYGLQATLVVVETDYVGYMIIMQCLNKDIDSRGSCLQPELTVWVRKVDYKATARARMQALLSGALASCIHTPQQLSRLYDTPHGPPPCLGEGYYYLTPDKTRRIDAPAQTITYPNTYPYTTYPYNTYPYTMYPNTMYPNNMYPYNMYPYNTGYNYGHQGDAELIRLRKEKLIAEKEMLLVEKEVHELEKEKKRLENDILRRGGSIPK